MKQFSLKQKKSVIKTLKEPPKEKPGINWQRILFIGVLLLIAFSIGKRIYRGTLLIIGDGQVRLAKQSVNFTDDIRLSSILVEQGDTVRAGDTLFYYKYETKKNSSTSIVSSNEPADWLIREKLNTKKQISIKRAALKRFKEELAFKKKELEHQKELIILGVNDIESRLSYIQNDIIRLEAEKDVNLKEIYYLRRHLKALEEQEIEERLTKIKREEGGASILPYVAQITGIIGQIQLDPNEVCYKQEIVLAIHQLNNLSIKAFFDPYDVPHINKGDKVWVEFPDGTSSSGLINNFYVSTYEVPAEFQKKYEPVERNIVAEVLPMNELELGKWLKFYKMQAEVSKYRFKWPW